MSRRRLLQASSGAVGLVGLGTGLAAADDSDDVDLADNEYCSETTLRPSMVHYDDSMHEVCEDDHPESQAIQTEVRESLEAHYPTVGALMDAGFIPYFDFFDDGDWSHWINPEFIGDDAMVDADRPESILVDHTYWRPIGVMFIATDGGKPVDPPPTIYVDEADDHERACIPWHAHTGFPGRYSWWKYHTVHHGPTKFPCRTPWMMHVWIFPHQESIYAHAAPAERGEPPAEEPGFETEADPNEETLGPEHLPDAVLSKTKEML